MPSCSVHEAYAWMKEVTSSNSRAFDVSCRREFKKVHFCFLWNHPKSVMHVRSILWSDRLIIFIPYVFPSTPSHWLICSRRRSSFLRIMTYVRTSLSSLMVPHLNSVVFYYKTTVWPFLSWTTCSHVCSRTSSCFGACYRSSFPENLATSSLWLVLLPFFFQICCLEYSVTNQIWISGRYDGWNIPKSCILFPVRTTIVPISMGCPSQ